MYTQIILMGAAVALVVLALLISEFVRVVFRESIFYRRHHCKIKVQKKGVWVERFMVPPKEH